MVHVVDSDRAIADGLATLLGTYGIDVLSHHDAEAFMKYRLPRRAGNCCLITDADLPDHSGLALLRELRELHVNIPVLMLVGTSSPELFEASHSSNQISMIRKPCLDRTLIDRVLSLRAAGESGSVNDRPEGEQ